MADLDSGGEVIWCPGKQVELVAELASQCRCSFGAGAASQQRNGKFWGGGKRLELIVPAREALTSRERLEVAELLFE